MQNRPIRPIAIKVISGSSVVITIPEVFLRNKKHFSVLFELQEPDKVKFLDEIEGNEKVLFQNGIGGNSYIAEAPSSIMYADRLRLGHCYRMCWENNGAASTSGNAGGVQHFSVKNAPCCARPFNPANRVIPTTEG